MGKVNIGHATVISGIISLQAMGAGVLAQPRDATPEPRCISGEDVRNTDSTTHVPRIPSKLRSERPTQSFIIVKACISATGVVDKIFLLKSSGNATIDKWYQTEVAKLKFKPEVRSGEKVSSVRVTTFHWPIT
jgi:hypothetical protein